LLPAGVYLRASRVRRAIGETYARLFDRVDLLLTPAAPFASYRIDDPPQAPVGPDGDRMAPLVRFSGPFNLTGQPALTVPCALTDQGLPIAVQLVGRPFAEETLLHVAHMLEREVADRVPRPRDNPLVA
jgi:aspartyl-tRNA(Asn)/glutamyl-tRNA(Gln) amidotransferase subunit A